MLYHKEIVFPLQWIVSCLNHALIITCNTTSTHAEI